MQRQRRALLVHHAFMRDSLCVISQVSRMEANVASRGPQIMSSLLSRYSKDSSGQGLKISEALDWANDSTTKCRAAHLQIYLKAREETLRECGGRWGLGVTMACRSSKTCVEGEQWSGASRLCLPVFRGINRGWDSRPGPVCLLQVSPVAWTPLS